MIIFYNTLKRKKQVFVPIKEGEVRMYTCGLTVYDRGHIGNFRTFIFEDILRRYLEYRGYKVIQVMNITDVDDKTIRGALASGKSLRDYTDYYTELFFKDIEILNIERAEYYPRATEHIPDMVELIKILMKKGYAYESKGSIYFRISAFPEYGKLSGLENKDLIEGYRVDSDEYEKESVKDFVLWKAAKEGEPYWETELGPGRPGWHIECSVMSMKYLGETFDIHAGGVDLIFPHHENEIAQSEAATGKQFVNYWLHSEHLIIEGEKMSKSKGNFYTVNDLIQQGIDPLTLRFLLMSAHYRKQLNYTSASISQAKEAVDRLISFKLRLMTEVIKEGSASEKIVSLLEKTKTEFENAMDDDLNISSALASIFELIRQVNILIDNNELTKGDAELIILYLKKFDKVLGVIFTEKDRIEDGELISLIEERNRARKEKNYQRADEIRDYLLKKGIILEDTKTGTRWKRKL
jgi:cysteinyl-tRNA synthetase